MLQSLFGKRQELVVALNHHSTVINFGTFLQEVFSSFDFFRTDPCVVPCLSYALANFSQC